MTAVAAKGHVSTLERRRRVVSAQGHIVERVDEAPVIPAAPILDRLLVPGRRKIDLKVDVRRPRMHALNRAEYLAERPTRSARVEGPLRRIDDRPARRRA